MTIGKLSGLWAVYLLISVSSAWAGPRFYTLRDVRCQNKTYCVFKESGVPFNGKLKKFYNDGRVSFYGDYHNGRPDGSLLTYFSDSRVKSIENYRDGKLDGYTKEFYQNGNMRLIVAYFEGKKDGYLREYYEDGTLKREINYQDGEAQGSENGYYPNGDNFYRVSFSHGKAISGYCFTKSGRKVFMNEHLKEFVHSAQVVCEDLQ